jgi:hypothetical protein
MRIGIEGKEDVHSEGSDESAGEGAILGLNTLQRLFLKGVLWY